jgi:hypothetical protein
LTIFIRSFFTMTFALPILGLGLLKPGVGMMTKVALASALDSGDGLLEEQIRMARLAHAERLTATEHIHNASVLRLQVLKDELAPMFAQNRAASRVVDLALVPGDPPRLWIDMTSYVTMAPDPQTYRLQRDTFCRRELLLESRDRSEIITSIMAHVASHLVEREKQLSLMMTSEEGRGETGIRKSSLILAWLAGLTLGISVMAAVINVAAR